MGETATTTVQQPASSSPGVAAEKAYKPGGYNVAFVQDDLCVAQKGCRLCIMYCPEPDCIVLDKTKMKAFVVQDQCKGCELCVTVCNAAKHKAIEMRPVVRKG